MKQPVLWLLAILVTLSSLRSQGAPAFHRFEKDIEAFEAQDKIDPPPKGAILFAGDSTFTKWKTIHEDLRGYSVINRGFGGSEMPDLLFFADRIVIPYKPRLIVVQEGGNDIHGGRTPEQLMADTKGFVEKVRAALPGVPILLDSITPNPARFNELPARIKANRLLKEYAASQKNVTYVNLFDPFLGTDGKPREELFVADHVHPSHAGYEVRVKILEPLMGPPDHR